MTLASSGAITSAQINSETGQASFDMNGTEERNLAGRPSGSYSWSDYWGQTGGGSVSLTDTDQRNTSSGVYTATVTTGASAWNRRVFVCVQWDCLVDAVETLFASGTPPTIGGVTATIDLQFAEGGTSAFSNYGCAIISAIVPTGTTAVLTMTFANTTVRGVYVTVFRATGVSGARYDFAFDFDEQIGAGTSTASSVINRPTNGVEFISAIYSSSGVMSDLTFVGATQQVDAAGVNDSRRGCAMKFPTVFGNSTTVSCSADSTVTARMRMVAVTYAIL